MDILIIGGHGKIALLTAPLLADAGHTVTSAIRNPEHADDVRTAGAEPLVLDVEHSSPAELEAAMRGRDVVVWSAGAVRGAAGDLAGQRGTDDRGRGGLRGVDRPAGGVRGRGHPGRRRVPALTGPPVTAPAAVVG